MILGKSLKSKDNAKEIIQLEYGVCLLLLKIKDETVAYWC